MASQSPQSPLDVVVHAVRSFSCAARHHYIHYCYLESIAFCTDKHATECSGNSEEGQELWVRSLEESDTGAVATDQFGVDGGVSVLRGVEKEFNQELDTMRTEFELHRAGLLADPSEQAKNRVRVFAERLPTVPQAGNLEKFTPLRHIRVLCEPVSVENVTQLFAGEAHIYSSAFGSNAFFPFLHLLSVWCLYMCKIGFRHDIPSVVLCLHTMGMAHRQGDEGKAVKEREHILTVVRRLREEAYGALNWHR